jgi:hypothetical protein
LIMDARSPLKQKPLRYAGQSLDEEIGRLLYDKLLSYFLLAATFWVVAWLEWFARAMHYPRHSGVYAVAAVFFTGALSYKVWRIRGKVRRLPQGHDGEREVAEVLEEIVQSGSYAVHDVPADGFNLDHVVIGARGIYVIETKTWSKPNGRVRIEFDGEQLCIAGKTPARDPLVQCRAAVHWLRGYLKQSTSKDLPVRGVVVFPGWWVERLPTARGSNLWVLNPKQLAAWISQEREMLDPSDVAMARLHLQQYIRGR